MDTHTHLASDHQVQLYRAASCSPVTFQLLDLLHVDLELLLQLPLVLLQLLHQLFEILQEDTEQRQKTENRKQESGRESGSSGCCSIAHQVVIGEPRELLLDAVLHLSLWRQRHHVAELFLLILDVSLQQLDLSVKGLQLVFVLPGLSLQLSLQQPGRTGRTRVLLTDTENNKTPKQTKKQTKTQQNTAQTDQW